MSRKLYIIGAGPGDMGFLTQRALQVLESCDKVYSTAGRYVTSLSDLSQNIVECAMAEIPAAIAASKDTVLGLLVSGDTGFFSVTASLLKSLEGIIETEVVCGISSLQYFCAKTGISYENMKVVSLHGREGSILGAAAYNHRVFVLTGGAHKADSILKELAEAGMSHIKAYVGEKLSMEGGRIVAGSVGELAEGTYDELSVLLLENPDFVKCSLPLCDRDFVRGEVPMTKEEIRAVALAKLAVQPGDLVYDVGAGTGSVAIEMARRACDGRVFAIEKNAAALELINENRKRLGAYNVTIVPGTAPDAFTGLPVPNKAFIGGSSGNMEQIIEGLRVKNPHIDIVANTITLEGLNACINSFESSGFNTEIVCINSAAAKKTGKYHMMSANNPVYIISGRSP